MTCIYAFFVVTLQTNMILQINEDIFDEIPINEKNSDKFQKIIACM